MRKISIAAALAGLLVLLGCTGQVARPRARSLTSTPNPHLDANYFLTATSAPIIVLPPTPTLTGELATIVARFDMGGGGAGFASTIYAQEVSTGKTFHTFMSAGMHGLVVLPTSPPVSFAVQAPGTYVFYSRLINAPEHYHYGATACGPSGECDSHALFALEVLPNRTYEVYIADRAAELPEANEPVTVPWVQP
jgi:hypothetical protein